MTTAKTERRTVWPDGMHASENPLKMSPGVMCDGFLYVTGMTGSRSDGSMPTDPAEQFEHAFIKIGAVLNAAGFRFADVVDMTSYHVDIRTHFDTFADIRARFVRDPYPTWTAVGVAELRRVGALVEVKVTAKQDV